MTRPEGQRGSGALTLTRRVGQRVLVGDDLTVEVVEVRGLQVRLRFTTAPGAERVPIWREELVRPQRPDQRCERCGRRRDDHNVRHNFVSPKD